jgi:hypothetical protein
MLKPERLWANSLIGLLLTCLFLACGGADATDEESTTGAVPGVDASIAFVHEGVLILQPVEQIELLVHTSPAAPYGIAFHLLGDALDASLDRSQATADDDGRAEVELRAPGMAATFTLRATIQDGPSVELPVSVSKDGFGSFNVLPNYAGKRPVDKWTVSVASGTNCSAVAELWPEEPAGAFGTSGSGDKGLVVSGLPVGPNLTVVVRAGHYLWGCADESKLTANATLDVDVNIINKPLLIEGVSLNLSFDFVPTSEPYGALMNEHQQAMLKLFGATASETAKLLLEQMAQVNGAIEPNTHQLSMEQHLAAQMVALSTTLDELATKGLAAQATTIDGVLQITDAESGLAQLSISSIAGVSGDDMAVTVQGGLNLTVDPDDTVRLGGGLQWLPSRLIGGAISAQAVIDYPNQQSVADVLATEVSCSTLSLTAGGACDIGCMRQACRQALKNIWDLSLGASSESLTEASLPFEAAGDPTLADDATLTGFHGMWLGKVMSGMHTAPVSGAVSANTTAESASMPPPPKR